MASVSEERIPAGQGLPELVVVSSSARRKTISAQPQPDGSVRLLVPAGLSRAEVLRYAGQLVPRVEQKRARGRQERKKAASDGFLVERAAALVASYLPELESSVGEVSLRWVTNQNQRWGSCTPATSSIRVSHLLQGAPVYVVDFVLHHELCHLLDHTHGARFRALEARYPRLLEARAFLEGLSFGRREAGQ